MQEHDAHASIAHWKQPVIATALALVATIAILILLTQMVTDTPHIGNDSESAVLGRIKPVGDIVLAAASAPKGQLSGEQVYNQVCKTCHETGLAGSPKFGDKAAWAPRIKTGMDTLYNAALKGIGIMPAKGGNPSLSDAEVKAAVNYMVAAAK